MIGAKYMVVGTVSMVGSTYSLESRLINVETSEAYISASFAHKGKIDVLLIDGISSIARQLCELDSNLQDSQSQQLSYIPAQPTKPALNLLKSKEKELKKKGSQYSSESIFLSFNFGDSKKEVKSKIDGLLKSGKLRDRCNQCNYGYPNYIFNLEGSNRYFHMQFLYTNDELYCIKLEGHWLAPDEYEAMASLYKQKYGTGTGFTKKETQTLEGWRAYNAYIWEINNDLEIFIYMKDVGEANTYIQYLSRTLQESKKYNDKKKSKESIDDL